MECAHAEGVGAEAILEDGAGEEWGIFVLADGVIEGELDVGPEFAFEGVFEEGDFVLGEGAGGGQEGGGFEAEGFVSVGECAEESWALVWVAERLEGAQGVGADGGVFVVVGVSCGVACGGGVEGMWEGGDEVEGDDTA